MLLRVEQRLSICAGIVVVGYWLNLAMSASAAFATVIPARGTTVYGVDSDLRYTPSRFAELRIETKLPVLQSVGEPQMVTADKLQTTAIHATSWNKGRILGPKPPFKLHEIWAIRMRLQLQGRVRDLALFNLAIDSKLRGCDLVSLLVSDICRGSEVQRRATVIQHKTGQPVQFELTSHTRDAVAAWIAEKGLRPEEYLFPSRVRHSPHLSTRQYARVVKQWAELIGLDPENYGTHSLRRTKATLIYRRTRNLRAVQLLLGHRKLESTVRYLGIEVEDALEMAEQTEA